MGLYPKVQNVALVAVANTENSNTCHHSHCIDIYISNKEEKKFNYQTIFHKSSEGVI